MKKVTAILPTPEEVEQRDGIFLIDSETKIVFGEGADSVGRHLQRGIVDRIGRKLSLERGGPEGGGIYLALTGEQGLGMEGYTLSVAEGAVAICACGEAGLFYGVQSLLQLIEETRGGAAVRCVEVMDRPRHRWRVFMLDSGRQYQSVEFIERYIDLIASMKLNVFHWHLTEGLGWRIEIERYPQLTEVGAQVADGAEQQGFYTQEEIRRIVAYAAERYVEVVPEIDVPGHSEAALSAHPELTCFGEMPQAAGTFSPVIFCGGKEKTYEFLEGVLEEVCGLFPGQYIHLGGDEAPKENWDRCPDCQRAIGELGLANSHDLQIHFSNRLADALAERGRKVILWDDVVTEPGPELRENVAIHWWNYRSRKERGLRAALEQGREVLCSTNYYCYLNFPVTPWAIYQENRTFDVRRAYEENPSDVDRLEGLDGEQEELVLGIGGALWTDGGVRQDMIDRRVFPRLFALAEQMWHRGERLAFDEFYGRVKERCVELRERGVDCGPGLVEEIDAEFSWE